MEKIRFMLKESNRSLSTSDHLLYMTYPLIKDMKILMSVIENLNRSLVGAMDSLLYYERYYKRLSFIPEDFQSRLELFKRVAEKYNIDRESVQLIRDIKGICDFRAKSPMEFARRDKFVISDDEFKLKTINYEKIKDYLNKSKVFISKVNKIVR